MEWTSKKPTEPGYYWWRQGDRIEPCQIKELEDSDGLYLPNTLEAWFIGEDDPIVQWSWLDEWFWMPLPKPPEEA